MRVITSEAKSAAAAAVAVRFVAGDGDCCDGAGSVNVCSQSTVFLGVGSGESISSTYLCDSCSCGIIIFLANYEEKACPYCGSHNISRLTEETLWKGCRPEDNPYLAFKEVKGLRKFYKWRAWFLWRRLRKNWLMGGLED